MFGLEFIKKLKPASFKYKQKETEKTHLGFIAQDIAKILDDETKYALLKKDDKDFYLVDHGELIAPLVKAVQELADRVETLESEKK